MSQLAQLQRDLQAHVLNSDTAIAAAIDASPEVPAATRLRIYFDAYRLRLIEALQATYPVLEQLLGADAFSRLAQLYLAVYPSQHFSIRWFGHRLAEFLADYPDYRDRPWLNELASWEWATAIAFDARDAAPLNIAEMASVAPTDWPELCFACHASLQRIALSTNVVSLVKAAAANEELPAPALAAHSVWLIWRQDLTVRYRSLAVAESAALEATMHGENFSVICEAIAQCSDAENAPLSAASFLKQWLTDCCVIELRKNNVGNLR